MSIVHFLFLPTVKSLQSPLLNKVTDVLYQMRMVCPRDVREGNIHLEKSGQQNVHLLTLLECAAEEVHGCRDFY